MKMSKVKADHDKYSKCEIHPVSEGDEVEQFVIRNFLPVKLLLSERKSLFNDQALYCGANSQDQTEGHPTAKCDAKPENELRYLTPQRFKTAAGALHHTTRLCDNPSM